MPDDSRKLTGLVAVVTGGTRGIGQATALALAAAGANVIINSREADVRGRVVLAQLAALGAQGSHIPADVSVADDVAHLVEAAWAWQGHVDLWVNNAGADILSGGRYRLNWRQKLEQLLAVDVWGTVTCSEVVGERMVQQGEGHIINIGWDQAEVGAEMTASGRLFALAKGGIMDYTRALARALAPAVRVNCVAPGWIETAWGEEVSSARKERIRQQIPLLRWGTPDDIAQAILWLASPAASYITGQTLRINGGVAVS